MSTICFLDPTVRRERARRSQAIRDVRDQADKETGATRLQLIAFANKLDEVRKASYWTGALKQSKFFKMAKGFYNRAHTYAAKAEERIEKVELAAHRRAKPWYRKAAEKVGSLFRG